MRHLVHCTSKPQDLRHDADMPLFVLTAFAKSRLEPAGSLRLEAPYWSPEAAQRRPQTVTKHGRPAVVVLAANEYERLRHLEDLEALSFADQLLAIPTDDGNFERLGGDLRDAER